MIAGVASGVGKTTIATGLMGALVARGLRVQGFKVGPDYIDPSYHARVTGRPSRNLDSWLLPRVPCARCLPARPATADVAVVEGVMGLYDGRHGGGEEASTRRVAKLLGLPVVLVVDASRQARSAAATVLGFRAFDPARAPGRRDPEPRGERGPPGDRRPRRSRAATRLPGARNAVPRGRPAAVPERYLGLVPTRRRPAWRRAFPRAVAAAVADGRPRPPAAARRGRRRRRGRHARRFPRARAAAGRLAVARDRAFGFYYADALDLLAAHGLEVAEFSPLADPSLPPARPGCTWAGDSRSCSPPNWPPTGRSCGSYARWRGRACRSTPSAAG